MTPRDANRPRRVDARSATARSVGVVGLHFCAQCGTAQRCFSGYVIDHHPTRRDHPTNRIELIGRLTRDPELRSTHSGKSVGSLRLAVDRRDRDADPVYVDVIVWNGLADTCAQHLTTGRQVAVSGRLDYREWQTDTGEKRSKHEVVADDIDFLAKPASDSSDAA